jgi:hypothetical protein
MVLWRFTTMAALVNGKDSKCPVTPSWGVEWTNLDFEGALGVSWMCNHRLVVSSVVFWRIVCLELEVDFNVVARSTTRFESYVSKNGSTGKDFDLVSFGRKVKAERLEGIRVGDVDDLADDAGVIEVVRVGQKFKPVVEGSEIGFGRRGNQVLLHHTSTHTCKEVNEKADENETLCGPDDGAVNVLTATGDCRGGLWRLVGLLQESFFVIRTVVGQERPVLLICAFVIHSQDRVF